MLILLAMGACSPEPATEAYDVLIVGGTVYDGSLQSGRLVNIGVSGDQIISTSAAADAPAARIVDASGKIVVPGFIDPHTHELGRLTKDGRNLHYLHQGVTTVFVGNDGDGVPNHEQRLAALESQGIGSNVGFFAGHGALRKAIMGMADRPASASELTAMSNLLAEKMQAGAFGLSTGLFYAPGSYANADEVIELARVAAAHGGIYDTHLRSESSHADGLLAAIDEAITIARESGIAVHISHIKALGKDSWGKSEDMIALIEAAREAGLDITANQYPWIASGTRFSNALIPRWVMADSKEKMLERLDDPELGPGIRLEMSRNLELRGGPEAMLVTHAKSPYAGKTLADIAADLDTDPLTAAIQVVAEGDPSIASFVMNKDDIDRLATRPWVMTGSDGSSGHPRLYGTYPKAWRDFVSDTELMTVEQFVHRSSGQVADTLGICDRGYLRAGYYADIAVIDPDSFAPLADYTNPVALSRGVELLLVNGEIVLDPEFQPALPGRVLRKTPEDCLP